MKCPPSFRSVHVSLDRRTFVSRAARMAAAAAVAPSHALDAPASAVVFTDDPLGVRGDFPILRKPYEIHELSRAIAKLPR